MASWMDLVAEERASERTSARERLAPREASRCAVARPMPEAAPVMAKTLPSREAMDVVEKVAGVREIKIVLRQ